MRLQQYFWIVLASVIFCLSSRLPAQAGGGTLLATTGNLKVQASSQWTATECRELQKIIVPGLAKLVAFYGPPSRGGTIIVWKTASTTSDVNVDFPLSKYGFTPKAELALHIPTEVFERPGLIVHELAHCFHGNYVICLKDPARKTNKRVYAQFTNTMEEGMAQAAMIRIEQELRWKHSGTEFVSIDSEFNKPAMATHWVDIKSGTLYRIRLNLAAWCFNHWEDKHPGFLRKLNGLLYKEPAQRLPISYTGSVLPLGERVTPGFAKWIMSQHVFNDVPSPGAFAWVVGDKSKFVFGTYNRATDGRETPQANQPVLVTVTVAAGSKSSTLLTGPEGTLIVPFTKSQKAYVVSVLWGRSSDMFIYSP